MMIFTWKRVQRLLLLLFAFSTLISVLIREAHELIIGELRVAINKTAANQDSGTNDLSVSQILRLHETQVWFLAEHLVDTPLVRS